MRLIQLLEAPINAMQVDPDFNRNIEQRERTWGDHPDRAARPYAPDYRPVDVKALNDPGVLKKIEQRFLKVPQKINLFFWASKRHENDISSKEKSSFFTGVVSPRYLAEIIGDQAAARVLGQPDRDNAITIVIANNRANAEGFVSLRSPWMVGHRMAHILLMTEAGYQITRDFREYMEFLLQQYELDSSAGGEAQMMFRREWVLNPYMGVIAHFLGTTRASRDGNLNNVGEFMVESLVQYILRGKVTFRDKLPEELPFATTNPEPYQDDSAYLQVKPEEVSKTIRLFEKLLNASFARLMAEAVGKIMVI